MTFKVEGFSVPKLEERLRDLTEQNIFTPQLIIVDGFPFDEASPEPLQQLRDFSNTHGLRIWFSVKTHRHEEPGPNGIPPQLSNIDDLFNVILQLQPEGKNVHVKVLRGVEEKDYPELLLDPATMLISRSE
jgi:hypothetical protein